MRLEAGEVHLWWGQVGVVGDPVRAWLSDEERGRAERFRRERDAGAFLFRRAFLRAVLARYVAAAPAALRFTHGEFGKPALAPASDVSFNASSSGAQVLVAVARGCAVGVDVERTSAALAGPEELSRLAARVLTPREQAALRACEPADRPAAFLRLWTRKEAVLKLLGTGLSREPDTLEVGLEPAATARVLAVAGLPAVSALVTLDLAAPPGHCASVVAAAEGEEVVFRVLEPLRPRGARSKRAR